MQNHGIFCSTHILLKMGDQTLPTVDFWIKSRITVYITAKDTEKKANSTRLRLQRCLFSDLFCPNVRNGSCKAKSAVLGVQTAANHIWWCESDYSAPLHKYKLYSQSLQIIWRCTMCTGNTVGFVCLAKHCILWYLCKEKTWDRKMIEYVCNWCNKSSLETSDRVSSFSWAKMWTLLNHKKTWLHLVKGFNYFTCCRMLLLFFFHQLPIPFWYPSNLELLEETCVWLKTAFCISFFFHTRFQKGKQTMNAVGAGKRGRGWTGKSISSFNTICWPLNVIKCSRHWPI